MAVSKRLRFEIFKRDNNACRYCGAAAPEVKITIDHVTPTALGGSDAPDNLVTACADCNSGKSSMSADTATVAEAKQHHEQWRGAVLDAADQDRERQEFATAFLDAWDDLAELPPGWRKNIDSYRLSGLVPHMWAEIVAIVAARPAIADRFRYCCGVARNRVAQLQGEAQATLKIPPCKACAEHEESDPIQDAIVDIWVNESAQGIGNDEGHAFSASVASALHDDHEDVHRLAEAALHAAWLRLPTIDAALAHMDRAQITQSWSACWYGAVGEFPNSEQQERVAAQVDALLKAERYNRPRVEFAAIYAGAHRSTRLHYMLGEDELAATGQQRDFIKMLEAWSGSFRSTSGRWPSNAEGEPLWDAMGALPLDKCTWEDLRSAAAMAAMYQSADLRPCFMPFGDAFAAAALLPGPSA